MPSKSQIPKHPHQIPCKHNIGFLHRRLWMVVHVLASNAKKNVNHHNGHKKQNDFDQVFFHSTIALEIDINKLTTVEHTKRKNHGKQHDIDTPTEKSFAKEYQFVGQKLIPHVFENQNGQTNE